jgi:hypothetical protein
VEAHESIGTNQTNNRQTDQNANRRLFEVDDEMQLLNEIIFHTKIGRGRRRRR